MSSIPTRISIGSLLAGLVIDSWLLVNMPQLPHGERIVADAAGGLVIAVSVEGVWFLWRKLARRAP